jgi:glycosyltransferase involved in cell wall biosynthesis
VAVTLHNISEQAKAAGYTVHSIDPSYFRNFSLPGYKEIKLAFPFSIGRKIQELQPDYIHIATEGPVGLAAKLYCDKHKLNYNTSYHTRFPEYLHLMYKVPTSITYRYMRWFHRHNGLVLTTTSTMCDILKANGINNAIPWTRGVDTTMVTPRTVQRDTTKVLYVGRVSKEKNLESLLSLPFDITIVGDGPDRSYLENKYNATFTGFQTGKDLFKYYEDADVFCFPSKTDTFGIVMIEAIAAGTPVAAYNVTGPKDIVLSGVNGILGDDLYSAILKAKTLPRQQVLNSFNWTWQQCWTIFQENLIKCK